MSQTHNVFVYGTLMRGFGNNYLLSKSNFVGVAITQHKYVLVAKSIPFVLNGGEIYERHKAASVEIMGELYQVEETDLPSLDMLEGHPSWYKREKVPITAINSNGEKFNTSAWLYFNNHEDGTVVSNGSYRRYCNEQQMWYNEYHKKGINV